MTAPARMNQTVSLASVIDQSMTDAELEALLAKGSVDVESFLDIAEPICLPNGRSVAERCITEAVCLSAAADVHLIVTAGRVELIPLTSENRPELLGEGQVRHLAQGVTVGIRPSAGTDEASLVEVSSGTGAWTECSERLPEVAAVPVLRDYYYGYSDRYASVYAAGAPLWEPPEPNEALVQALESMDIEPCSVIDFGCGEGRDTIYLASKGFDAVGVDVARPALAKARERAAAAQVEVTFLERDICVLADPPRDSFDLAINMGCLHMLPDSDLRAAHLKRVHELLAPQGLFLVAHCRERWLDGFFSVPDYESVGPVVPGRVIPRRIRLEDGSTTELMLPLVPYKESPTSELIDEICGHGFSLVADLSSHTAAFGSTTVLALRKRTVHG